MMKTCRYCGAEFTPEVHDYICRRCYFWRPPEQCRAVKDDGERCRAWCVRGEYFCGSHLKRGYGLFSLALHAPRYVARPRSSEAAQPQPAEQITQEPEAYLVWQYDAREWEAARWQRQPATPAQKSYIASLANGQPDVFDSVVAAIPDWHGDLNRLARGQAAFVIKCLLGELQPHTKVERGQ
jgi:hypothetical protein